MERYSTIEKSVDVDGLRVFYREAGPEDAQNAGNKKNPPRPAIPPAPLFATCHSLLKCNGFVTIP